MVSGKILWRVPDPIEMIYMKRPTLTLLFGMLAFCVQAQDFKSFRYDEDYRNFGDSITPSWYDKLKFTSLNKQKTAYISAGGEIRYQYFQYKHEDWGDAPDDSDGFILTRILLHSDLHVNSSLRFFVQLQSSLSDGRVTPPPPVEQNELDLHQAFVDVTIAKQPAATWVMRAGRQELAYGSSRLVSVREGPNNRQSFDGVKLFAVSKHVKADFFFAEYVSSKTGIFNDDVWNSGTRFGGAYLTFSKVPVFHTVDVYYFGIRKSKSTWSDISGREVRHSVGARVSGKKTRWQYDFEGVYQFGDMEDATISAWTLSSNTTYALANGPTAPFLGLKTEFISGDERREDKRIQSFNPLFPKGAYFGYAALIGPSNLFDIHPSLGIPLGSNFLASIDYDVFWRYSTEDGIYNPGARPIYGAGDSDEKFIGHQIGGNVDFVGSKFVYLRAEVTWFKPGPYIRSVSAGENIWYSGLTATLKF
jgi:hypothetical protein